MRSIRNNLAFSILLPILVVFIILGAAFVTYLDNTMTSDGNEKMMLSAAQTANSVDSVLQNVETKVKMLETAVNELSDDKKIREKDPEYFNEFEKEINNLVIKSTIDIDGLLSSYIRYEPSLSYGTSGIFYLDTDNNGTLEEVMCTDLLEYDASDTEHVGWFYTPLSNKKPIWMEPYYNANIDKTVVSYIIPFYLDDGQNFGILGIDFDFDYLNNLLLENQKYHEGDTYLTNAEGKILYHPNYTNGENFGEIENNLYSSAISQMSFNSDGFMNEKVNSDYLLLGYSTLNTNGWKICITPTYDDIYGKLQTAKIVLLIFMLIATIIMFIISFFMGNQIAKPIVVLTKAVERMANGELNETIDIKSKNEIGALATYLEKLVEQLKNYELYINEITSVLNELKDGNLNISLVNDYSGEFSKIKEALYELSEKLTHLIGSIKLSAEQVSYGSNQVANGAQALAQGATEQASSIEELSATVTEISQQIEHNAQNTQLVHTQSVSAGTEVKNSNNQMQDMIVAMNNINTKSTEISKIVKTIEDIAFQTNILALNAAIEAARAGSAGKGFAVVADEVRNLAQKSAEAAKSTTNLIEETVQAVDLGTEIAESTALSMQNVVENTNKVMDLINEIAQASKEQAMAVSQVTTGIDQISSVVQTNSATAEESAAASEELSGQAQMLMQNIEQFKLKKEIDSNNDTFNHGDYIKE